jgi:hypothetical protein
VVDAKDLGRISLDESAHGVLAPVWRQGGEAGGLPTGVGGAEAEGTVSPGAAGWGECRAMPDSSGGSAAP